MQAKIQNGMYEKKAYNKMCNKNEGRLERETMKTKKIAAWMAAVAAAGILAGCSAGWLQVGKPKNAKADAAITLTVSVWDNASSPQFQAIADAFMEKYSDIKVELLDMRADEYDNQLGVMLAGGESEPDVIMVKNAETQVTMKNQNQLLDLTEYVQADKVDLSLYNGAAEQLQMDGRQYTLPFRQDWYVLYYNKDLFDAAGVPYPDSDMTWEEYEALAEKMTGSRKESMGEDHEKQTKVYGTHNHTWMALVSNWAVQDGRHTLMSEDYSFLKPYYEQALRMQDKEIVQNYANLKTSSIHYIGVFEQQQCAMLPMGTWFLSVLIQDQKNETLDFSWGVTRIPHPEGVEAGATVGSVTPVAINAKTDVPQQAWEFVKFATSEEGAGILADNSVFPAIMSEKVIDRLASIEGFPKDGKEALKISSVVFDRPLDGKMAAVRKVIEEEHDRIMIGEEDVDTGIANMNRRAAQAKTETDR